MRRIRLACIGLIPGGDLHLLRLPLKRREVILEARPLILHEDDVLLRHARDLIEAEVSEEARGITLRIQEEMVVSTAVLHLDEMGNDRVHEGLALVIGAHRHTTEGVSEQAASRDDMIVLVEHRSRIVEMLIPVDTLPLEERVHLCLYVAVTRTDR